MNSAFEDAVDIARPWPGSRQGPGTGRPSLLSVVMPAYNESAGIERSVATVAAELDARLIDRYEIVVVDDGSTDATYDRIARLSSTMPALRGVALSRNFGKEGALLAGLREARGDCVVTLDADLQHPPRVIGDLVEHWCDGAMIVHAVKRDRSTDGLPTRLRALLFNAVASRLGGVDLHHSSDFKLLDRSVVTLLTERLHERERFYRGLASWVGFRQERVQFDIALRQGDEGKWSLRTLFELALTATLSFTSAPLRVVTFMGLSTLCFAIVLTCTTLWSRLHGSAVSGFATIEITLLLLGSAIMISLGIMGEYVAKIYDEIKARPPYLVAARCGHPALLPGDDDPGPLDEPAGVARGRSHVRDERRLPAASPDACPITDEVGP